MNFELLRDFLLSKKGSMEEQPFGPEALVFKVAGKMFALVAWKKNPLDITLKCDPSEAEDLREQYEAVRPGYYMNKLHWNTVTLDGSIDDETIFEMIDQSYTLVCKKLTKREKELLN